jgi:hypothetical protein
VKSYQSSATIQASPDTIWAILIDGAKYPDWDSGVVSVQGRIAPGEKIKVVSSANPKRAFPVKVTEFTPGRSMTWSGGMPLGLFKGVRTYTLSAQPDGTTTFAMREEYSGPLTNMIGKSVPDLQPSFDQFAAGLKARAEGAR